MLITDDPFKAAATLRGELDLLTEHEVANMLELKVQTLRTWRCSSEGPAYTKLGKQVYYTLEALRAWIARNQLTPIADDTSVKEAA